MNKLHLVGGLIVLGAASSCRPIGPPPGHRAVHRPTPAPPSATANTAPPTATNPASANPQPAATATIPPVNQPGQTDSRPAPSVVKPQALPPASKPATPKDPYVTAQKAPNKPGYVLSPHTGKLVLVDGIPSGVVVPDQSCPAGEKKFFRVP